MLSLLLNVTILANFFFWLSFAYASIDFFLLFGLILGNFQANIQSFFIHTTVYTLLHSRKNSVKSCFSLSFYSLCDLWYSFHYMVLMFSFFNCDLPKILFFFLDLCFIFYTVLLKPNRMSSLEQSNSTDQIFMEITFPLIFVFTVERHGDLI